MRFRLISIKLPDVGTATENRTQERRERHVGKHQDLAEGGPGERRIDDGRRLQVPKVSKNTILNWEKGYTLPDADKAVKLSELYKLPLENIIFYKNS